jgi:hypothetical protein
MANSGGAAAEAPAVGASVHDPTSFVVPGPGETAAGTLSGGATQSATPPALAAPAGAQPAASARRAAAVTALLGTAVDVKPLYGTVIAAGMLALGVAVALRGLRPGGAR